MAALDIGQVIKVSYSIGINVPFERNERFTGRESELSQMHEVLDGITSDGPQQKYRKYVLHGLGGIGKTQLALEYCYQHQKDYHSIWWVNGATVTKFSQSFLGIAQILVKHHARCQTKIGKQPDYPSIAVALGLPPDSVDSMGAIAASGDGTKAVISAIKWWLAAAEGQRWLLIIDNYDDPENVRWQDFLPNESAGSSGSILFTSRASSSMQLAAEGNTLEITEMKEGDAVEILRKSARKPKSEFERGECELLVS